MTMVGTRGYTAPEVLRGLHYGTAADVCRFYIAAAPFELDRKLKTVQTHAIPLTPSCAATTR